MKSSKAANRGAVILLLLIFVGSASMSGKATQFAKRARRSDDANVETLVKSLQNVVDQQAAVIQTLLARVTALENETPNTVAFSVRLSADHDVSIADGVAIGPHQTLVFNEAITNVGRAYDVNTGIFTAPVAGTYAFFLSAMSTNKHSAIILAISKNGVTLDEVFAEGSDDLYDQGSSLVSTQLVKGDTVWVRQRMGDHVRGDYWTVFTGYLILAQ